MNENQKGFSVVEGLLILIIVGLIGCVGWYVWHAKNNADANLNSAASSNTVIPPTQQTKPKDTAQYLEIKEWGVKFKIPSNLTSIEYKINEQNNLAFLGSPQLASIAPTCTLDNIALGTLERDSGSSSADDAKHIGQYYYNYVDTKTGCAGANKGAQKMIDAVETQLKEELIPETLVAY